MGSAGQQRKRRVTLTRLLTNKDNGQHCHQDGQSNSGQDTLDDTNGDGGQAINT
jgi:hypothetical protein